jgi:hypothetical protein
MHWLVKVRTLCKDWYRLESKKASVLLWMEIFTALSLVGLVLVLLEIFLN